ncbi:MAG: hypothetical protein GY930_13875 [bacterium]|nr:hypothetical protein [bacterium]
MRAATTFLAVALLVSSLTGCQNCHNCHNCHNCQPCASRSAIRAADALSKAQQDLAAIGSAVSHFQRNNGGESPSDLQLLIQVDEHGKHYFGKAELPLDAYGRAYGYSQDDQGQTWELCFLGKDGARGGEGADADIGISQIESGN